MMVIHLYEFLFAAALLIGLCSYYIGIYKNFIR
jgi:hypothetical protein